MSVRKGQKLKHPERDEQELGTALMRAIGFSVLRFSQPVRTLQTPGIPDTFYFGAIRLPSPAVLDDRYSLRPVSLWWEWKKPGAKRTEVQERIGTALDAAGQTYGWGGFPELLEWLYAAGYVAHDHYAAVRILKRVQ